MPDWLQVTIRFSPDHAELVWASLYAQGCRGLEETGPGSCAAYFQAPADAAALRASLRARPFVQSLSFRALQDRDWNEEWKSSFTGFDVGPFHVRPSWRPSAGTGTRLEIVIDPGGAFGTGTHPTTQLCLEALAGLAAGARSMVDIGTGSGILSVAAVRRNPALRAVALDTDAEACRICSANAAANGTPVAVVCGPFSATRHHPDLVVANLQSEPLLHLRAELVRRTPPGARMLLSGILDEEAPVFVPLFLGPDLRLEAQVSRGGWLALVAARP